MSDAPVISTADDNKAAELKAADNKEARAEKRERMLCFIRDTLIERAWGLRTAFEANSFVYCESPEGKEQLKRVVALEAAADVFTYLVGEWQGNQKHPPWLSTIVGQAMATFVEAFEAIKN